MASNNNNESQRNKRYTIRLNEEENNLIVDAALDKNYSNKAIARFMREELLSSVSDADQSPIFQIPSVNLDVAKDLKGAVNNLNQSVKNLNRIALSSAPGEQMEFAKKMMLNAIRINGHCKALHDFSTGNTENKKLLASIVMASLSSDELKAILSKKSMQEAK